jgi:hypothetical protein
VPGWSLALHAIGASPDGHTFYVAYQAFSDAKSSNTSQSWIYRLSITGSGAVMPLTRIKGGVINVATALWSSGGSLALSPDGAKLALTVDNTDQRGHDSQGWADKIVVIDLATGARHVWRGLYRSGKTFTIPDISWTADGRSLVFLGLWCDYPKAASRCAGTSGPGDYRDTQVRSLSVGTGGGTLDRSAVLLSQSARYPVIAAAVAGPGPAELNVVVLSGKFVADTGSSGSSLKAAVENVSAVNGSLLGVAYRWAPQGDAGQPVISPDPSGHYLLLSYARPGGFHTGWIGVGKLHFLPVRQPYLGFLITAW